MPVLWIGASCLSKMNVGDGSGDMKWNGSSTFLRILGPWVWLVIQENSAHLSVLLHWQHTFPNPLIHLMRHCVPASVTGSPISSGLYSCWKSIFLFLSLTHSDSLSVCLPPPPSPLHPHEHTFFFTKAILLQPIPHCLCPPLLLRLSFPPFLAWL